MLETKTPDFSFTRSVAVNIYTTESSTETRSEKSEEAKKQIHLVCENFPYKTHFVSST